MTAISRVCGRVGRGGRQEANMVPDVMPALKQKGQVDIKNAKKETVWRALHKRRNIGAKTQQIATLCASKTTFEAGVNSQGLKAIV